MHYPFRWRLVLGCDQGVGPTITEMANALDCARSRIQDAVRKLEREQLINRQPGKTRGITPISGHEDPVAGYVDIAPRIASTFIANCLPAPTGT